jgi:hypothetical protein
MLITQAFKSKELSGFRMIVGGFTGNAFVNKKSPFPFNLSGVSNHWKEWN